MEFKFQIANFKSQTNLKFQFPNESQNPNPQCSANSANGRFFFGIWSLEFVWSLMLVFWVFRPPTISPNHRFFTIRRVIQTSEISSKTTARRSQYHRSWRCSDDAMSADTRSRSFSYVTGNNSETLSRSACSQGVRSDSRGSGSAT